MAGIQALVTKEALESNLPFDMLIEPDPEAIPLRTETVANGAKAIEFPMFGEYFADEQFFVEAVQSKAMLRSLELSITMQKISDSIKSYFGVSDPKETNALYRRIIGATEMLGNGTEKTDEESKAIVKAQSFGDEKLDEFKELYSKLLTDFWQLSATTASALVPKILLVTFFMRRRVDGSWDLINTQRLRLPTLDRIYELIQSEIKQEQDLTINTPEDATGKKDLGETGKKATRKPVSEAEQIGSELLPTFAAVA